MRSSDAQTSCCGFSAFLGLADAFLKDKILRKGAAADVTLAIVHRRTGQELWFFFPPLSSVSRAVKWQAAQPGSHCLCNWPVDSHQKQLCFLLLVFGVHKSLRRVHSPSMKATCHQGNGPEILSGAKVRVSDLTSPLGNPFSGWFGLVRSKCRLGEETSTL